MKLLSEKGRLGVSLKILHRERDMVDCAEVLSEAVIRGEVQFPVFAVNNGERRVYSAGKRWRELLVREIS